MKRNNTISQQIIELNGQLEKVMSKLNQAKNSLNNDIENKFEMNIEDAVKKLESATLKARDIVSYSFKDKNPYIYKKINNNIAKDIYNISISENEGIYKIVLPATISHYGDSTKSILTKPLNDALRSYAKAHRIKKIETAVIVFINHISPQKNENFIRDNDNYDYKQVINSVAFWFLPDDSFKCCNIFNTTKIGDCKESYSEIVLVPKEKFPSFYSKNFDSIL